MPRSRSGGRTQRSCWQQHCTWRVRWKSVRSTLEWYWQRRGTVGVSHEMQEQNSILTKTDTSFNDVSKIGECEFTLISEMNSQLILHHPYRSLAELQTQFQLTQEENALAWSIINDHYLTDLPLLHAPHVIAITAMFLAVVLKPIGSQVNAAGMNNALQTLGNARGGQGMQARIQKLVDWLAESSVDIEAVVECTQELISLYEVWETYTDKTCKDQIAKFVKARGLDK
ncbi:RNA polymerase II holoenzyme cyclin-like subunit [Alternaria alternata]|nr:RNA polymerase II holoenzyme cyclin-like subunit [Alternaria alternata]